MTSRRESSFDLHSLVYFHGKILNPKEGGWACRVCVFLSCPPTSVSNQTQPGAPMSPPSPPPLIPLCKGPFPPSLPPPAAWRAWISPSSEKNISNFELFRETLSNFAPAPISDGARSLFLLLRIRSRPWAACALKYEEKGNRAKGRRDLMLREPLISVSQRLLLLLNPPPLLAEDFGFRFPKLRLKKESLLRSEGCTRSIKVREREALGSRKRKRPIKKDASTLRRCNNQPQQRKSKKEASEF